MPTDRFSPVTLPDAVLEVDVRGSGEPVLLIQTALFADELEPLAGLLRDRFRVVVMHRRGYAGSTPVHGPGSVVRDALDCRHLLDALGVARAHVVGGSYAGAVALELAATAPEQVQSLTLVEPPPVHTRWREEFLAVCADLVEHDRRHGSTAALDRFLLYLMGPDWRRDLDRLLPGRGGARRAGRGDLLRHRPPRAGVLALRTRGRAADRRAGAVRRRHRQRAVVRRRPGAPPLLAAPRRGRAGRGCGPLAGAHRTPGELADVVARFLRRHPVPE